MVDSILQNLIEAISASTHDRHKLILVLGGFGAGKTQLLRAAADEVEGVYVNLNLRLTERLLQLPRSRYADGVSVNTLLYQLCDELSPAGQPLLIDNIELLFSPELGHVNPVDTLKKMSRERPIVLALPARRDGNYADYSTIGRWDYLRMEIGEYVVIDVEER